MSLLRSTGLDLTRPPLLHIDDWRAMKHNTRALGATTTEDEVEYRSYLMTESGMSQLPEVI